MPTFREMDRTVTLADQSKDDGGSVVLIRTFVVPSTDTDALLATRTADAGIMKRSSDSLPPSFTVASRAAAPF